MKGVAPLEVDVHELYKRITKTGFYEAAQLTKVGDLEGASRAIDAALAEADEARGVLLPAISSGAVRVVSQIKKCTP